MELLRHVLELVKEYPTELLVMATGLTTGAITVYRWRMSGMRKIVNDHSDQMDAMIDRMNEARNAREVGIAKIATRLETTRQELERQRIAGQQQMDLAGVNNQAAMKRQEMAGEQNIAGIEAQNEGRIGAVEAEQEGRAAIADKQAQAEQKRLDADIAARQGMHGEEMELKREANQLQADANRIENERRNREVDIQEKQLGLDEKALGLKGNEQAMAWVASGMESWLATHDPKEDGFEKKKNAYKKFLADQAKYMMKNGGFDQAQQPSVSPPVPTGTPFAEDSATGNVTYGASTVPSVTKAQGGQNQWPEIPTDKELTRSTLESLDPEGNYYNQLVEQGYSPEEIRRFMVESAPGIMEGGMQGMNNILQMFNWNRRKRQFEDEVSSLVLELLLSSRQTISLQWIFSS